MGIILIMSVIHIGMLMLSLLQPKSTPYKRAWTIPLPESVAAAGSVCLQLSCSAACLNSHLNGSCCCQRLTPTLLVQPNLPAAAMLWEPPSHPASHCSAFCIPKSTSREMSTRECEPGLTVWLRRVAAAVQPAASQAVLCWLPGTTATAPRTHSS
jgi:hypothetical protein